MCPPEKDPELLCAVFDKNTELKFGHEKTLDIPKMRECHRITD